MGVTEFRKMSYIDGMLMKEDIQFGIKGVNKFVIYNEISPTPSSHAILIILSELLSNA